MCLCYLLAVYLKRSGALSLSLSCWPLSMVIRRHKKPCLLVGAREKHNFVCVDAISFAFVSFLPLFSFSFSLRHVCVCVAVCGSVRVCVGVSVGGQEKEVS